MDFSIGLLLGGKENIQAEIYQVAALLIRLSENLEKENK